MTLAQVCRLANCWNALAGVIFVETRFRTVPRVVVVLFYLEGRFASGICGSWKLLILHAHGMPVFLFVQRLFLSCGGVDIRFIAAPHWLRGYIGTCNALLLFLTILHVRWQIGLADANAVRFCLCEGTVLVSVSTKVRMLGAGS